MSSTREIADLYAKYVMNTYAQKVALVKGQGTVVSGADGNRYIDFTSGIAVQNVGHAHPKVVQAVAEQMATLNHCSNLFYNEKQALLAKKLVEISDLDVGTKCFFCNSGAEANEAMIKLARLWGHLGGKGDDNGGYVEIVTMMNSFHGRTLATLTATGQAKVQDGFDPLPVGFAYADFNDIESVKAAINDSTVAVMLECIQGEGGVIPADTKFMKALRALCDEREILLLCDEVQCGMGRTGDWFAWQSTGVKPDAFSLAKAIASGVPMGAVVASSKLADVFTPGRHASTFGGNPLACAAALATIGVIESENLLERAADAGDAIMSGLGKIADAHPGLVKAIRGQGLMIGLALDPGKIDAGRVVDAARDIGLLVCKAGGNAIRILPPLNVTDDEIDDGLDILADAIDEVAGA
ncbi:MAG: aspartate aminotransferase family protein [Kiritimatiellae bacterium]|nr:aspartate aminotransferase family protein [Kiritimatiellia bacterium]